VRKMMLLGVLCLTGFALAPVTSASAFAGTCKIEGKAEFAPPLGAKLEETKFTFASSGGECTGTGAPTFEKATVAAEGNLSCAVANGVVEVKGKVRGSGTITLGGKTDEFEFKFVAAAGVVKFTAKGPQVNSAGNAEFLTDKKGLESCAAGEAKELEFKAVATGEFN
jgi:hypothetical protein